MDPQNIPLVMLFSFGGVLFGLGLLVLKGMQRQERRDEIERQARNHPRA
jgi:hypothetical protein